MDTNIAVDLKSLTGELGLTRRQLMSRMDQFIKSGLLKPGEDFWREYRGDPLPLEDYDRLKQFSIIKVNRRRILQLLEKESPLPSDSKVDDSLTKVNQDVNGSGNLVNDGVKHGQPPVDSNAPIVAALERENELLRDIIVETRKEREYYKEKNDDSAQKLEEKNDQIMGWMQQVIQLKDQVLQLASGNSEKPEPKVYDSVNNTEPVVDTSVNDEFTDVNNTAHHDEHSFDDEAFEHAYMPELQHSEMIEQEYASVQNSPNRFRSVEHARKLEVKYDEGEGTGEYD